MAIYNYTTSASSSYSDIWKHKIAKTTPFVAPYGTGTFPTPPITGYSHTITAPENWHIWGISEDGSVHWLSGAGVGDTAKQVLESFYQEHLHFYVAYMVLKPNQNPNGDVSLFEVDPDTKEVIPFHF